MNPGGVVGVVDPIRATWGWRLSFAKFMARPICAPVARPAPGAGRATGAQIGLAMNFANEGADAQVAGIGINYADHAAGVQLAPLGNLATCEINGAQLAAVANTAGSLTGVQLALMNASQVARGVQFGPVYNYAAHLRGVQFGLLNCCRKTSGVQIGLLNFSLDDPFPCLPLVYVHF